MLKNHIFYTFLLIFSTLFLLVSCEDTDRTTTPILPGEIAELAIEFTPEIVYQSYSDTYYFTVTAREVNGLGARLTSVKIERLDSSGNVIEKSDYDERWISESFGSSYLPSYSELRTSVSSKCYSCVSEHWLIRGIDDYDNYVETSGVVEFIRR